MGIPIDIVGGPNKSRIKLTYRGVFDHGKVYRDMVNWFKEHHYFFSEKIHVEMVKATGKEHVLNFSGTREVDDYVKYSIDVEIWTLRERNIDKKLVNGEIQIRIKGAMELDYKNKFSGKLGPVIRSFYHKYIIKKRIWTKYAGGIYEETNDLIRNFKSNLGLITT